MLAVCLENGKEHLNMRQKYAQLLVVTAGGV
jgi:hypothetical protein